MCRKVGTIDAPRFATLIEKTLNVETFAVASRTEQLMDLIIRGVSLRLDRQGSSLSVRLVSKMTYHLNVKMVEYIACGTSVSTNKQTS